MYKPSNYSIISTNKESQEIWYNQVTRKGVTFSKDIEKFICQLLSNQVKHHHNNPIDKDIINILLQELVDRGLIVPKELLYVEEGAYLDNLLCCSKPSNTFFNVDYLDIEANESEEYKDIKYCLGIFGVPFDYGSPKPGSRFGPNLLREASTGIANLKNELLKYQFSDLKLFDLGNINITSNSFLDICKKIEKVVTNLPKNVIPLMIGGDHSLSYAAIKAVYRKFISEDVVLVHFDHHNDMQFWGNFNGNEPTFLTKLNHANFISWLKNDLPNLQMLHLGIQAFNHKLHSKNIQAFHDLNSKTISNIDLLEMNTEDVIKLLPSNKDIYITFDVDVIKHNEISLTGYPSSLGVEISKIFTMIKFLIENNNIIGIDVMEFGLSDNFREHKKQSELICYLLLHMLKFLAKDKENI